jgi:PAS domain S-box-containing protein
METMPIDKLRMQFPQELEQAFQEESFYKSLNQLRISIAVVAVIYALFGVLDGLVTPEVKYQAWFIRYVIVIPVAIFVLYFTFFPQFKRYQQILVSFLVLVGGGGIVALIVLTQMSGRYFHFAGLLLVFMTSYTAFKLRFLYATVVCWTIVGLYEISAIWISHTSLSVLLTDNFFYISANLMGMFTIYQRELYQRKDFFRSRLVHKLEREKHDLEKDRMNRAVERAVASYRESEEKFRTLAETAAMAIFIHQGGNFLYANHAAEAIGGYTVDEYLTMNFMGLVHPDFVELVKTRARERLTGNSDVPAQYEFKIVRKDGEERWVLMTAGISEFEGKPAVIGTLIDITGRKQAEAERDKLALLIENSSDFIGMTDMDGKVIFVNSAGRKLVGLDPESDVRKTISDDYFMPEDLPEHRDHRRSGTWRGEFRLKHFKTSTPIPVDMYIFDVNDETSKKPVARAAVMRDITDLKRAREEREHYYQQLQQALQSLKESETRFRTLAETTAASIIIHRGGKFLYANSSVQKITGYTLDDFLHMEFWELVHPDYRDMVRERGQARMSGADVPHEYEFKVLTKRGEERWAVTSSGIIDYEGQPAIIATLFDITDHKHAEEEGERLNRQLQHALRSLQESEAKFRTLAETTTAAIFIHREGKLVYANPAGEAIAGYTNEEFLTMDFSAIIHPDYRELVMERGRARLRGERIPPEYEFKIVTKSGKERWVNMTAGIINYEGEQAVIGTLFDITDRKRAEEEQLNLYEQRIAVEKRHLSEKEEILMDLHDGIGGITTNISMLSEVGQKSSDVESVKKTLVTISRLSQEGITEIRSFMQGLDSRELSWHTMAAELRNQGTKMVDPHNMTLTVVASVDDGHDQPGSLLWINLLKIYKEALTNIVKHSHARTVAVTLQVVDLELLLTIQDDGIGYNGDKARTGGRGLSNMKRRAERLGGNMTINSGNGTKVVFTLQLPVKYPVQGIVS